MGKVGKAETIGTGLRVSPWQHRSYSWRVSYFTGHGSERKRKQKGFQTKKEAVAWAEKQDKKLKAKGAGDHEVTKEEHRAVMAFREIIDSLPDAITKPTLGEIVEDYRKKADVRRKSMTVSELIDRYITSLERRKLSKSHRYSTELRLRRFEDDHGEWMACDISDEVAGDWLHDLDLAALTVNHYRTALVQMFNHGKKINAVEFNPIEAVDKLKEDSKEVGILSPTEAAGLLSHCADEILPSLAIGLFAGLRRSEISRLDWSQIDFKQKHIEVKARNTKSAARRLVPMRNNLRKWLIPYRKNAGPVMPTEMIYRSRLDDAREAAEIEDWPHNALRHSFASYNLAAFENAPALAGEMGHGSTKMIFEHYRALVTPKEGKTYWKIQPSVPSNLLKIQSA